VSTTGSLTIDLASGEEEYIWLSFNGTIINIGRMLTMGESDRGRQVRSIQFGIAVKWQLRMKARLGVSVIPTVTYVPHGNLQQLATQFQKEDA
jgi:hypothetical protein